MTRLSDVQIEAASYRFEQCRGHRLGAYETSVISEAKYEHADPKELAARLWSTLQEEQPSTYRTSAYFALGKFGDRSELPKLVDALRAEVQRDIRVGYQIMIALDNLGESVFSRDSRGHLEDDANRRDALDYLAKQE